MIGITTTIPVEVLLAAGETPVDLNNIFISSPDKDAFINQAEAEGYPAGTCAWIKGIYSVAIANPEIDKIIAVTQGDCSNTHALMETLQFHGKEVIPFDYPYNRDRDLLELSIKKLAQKFGTDIDAASQVKNSLKSIREKLGELDRITWENSLPGTDLGDISGEENHRWLVSSSDFNTDYVQYERQLDRFLATARQRPARTPDLRLGYIGVPPIFSNLYEFLEQRRAKVVYNEVQRQFSMPFEECSLVEQYLQYTYPYDIFGRIEDIKREIRLRRIDGLVHYTQLFCFRQIQDIIVRKLIEIPILTLEGDRPGAIDARAGIRIEGFLEMLHSMK